MEQASFVSYFDIASIFTWYLVTTVSQHIFGPPDVSKGLKNKQTRLLESEILPRLTTHYLTTDRSLTSVTFTLLVGLPFCYYYYLLQSAAVQTIIFQNVLEHVARLDR